MEEENGERKKSMDEENAIENQHEQNESKVLIQHIFCTFFAQNYDGSLTVLLYKQRNVNRYVTKKCTNKEIETVLLYKLWKQVL